MSTFYRKYRPQNFDEIIGQEIVVKTLENALLHNIPAHSYLFTGPRGTGKTSLARIFAKALNCQNRKKIAACGKCAHCEAVEQNQSLDIIEIDGASYTGVDNVRTLRETMTNAPLLGKYRIYIIDEVHMLSIGAFNALLKMMEEPPAHVIFLLATTELHKVPKTILSRCQRFDLRKFTAQEIIEKLKAICKSESITIEPEALAAIAKSSGGSLRDAESLLTQLHTLAGGSITLALTQNTLGIGGTETLFTIIEGYCENDLEKILLALRKAEASQNNPIPFAQELISMFRNVLLFKAHQKFDIDPLSLLSKEEQVQISKATEHVSYPELAKLLLDLEEAVVKMKSSHFGYLPLEIAFAKNIQSSKEDSSNRPSPPPQEKSSSKQSPQAEAPNTQGASSNHAKSAIELKTVQEQWSAIIEKVKFLNTSLSVALQSARPLALENNVLQIAVKYKFHLERLHQPAHQLTLQEAFDTILGLRLAFSIIEEPKKSPASKASPDDPLIQHALELLGGSVI